MAERAAVMTVPLVSALLVAAGALWLLSRDLPDSPAEPLTFAAGQFSFVMGSGRATEGRLSVESYANGFALISTGAVSLQASARPVLEYQLDAVFHPEDPELAPAFFWRTDRDPQTVSRITLTGASPILLSREPEWSGTVVELGFLIPRLEGVNPSLGAVRLEPETVGDRLRWTVKAWFATEPWSQRSINYAFGGAPEQRLWLPVIVGSWVVLCWLGFLLLPRRFFGVRGRWWLIVAVLLVGWFVLDSRWTRNGLYRTVDSVVHLVRLDESGRAELAADGHYVEYIAGLKQKHLGREPARILLVGDPTEEEFYALRAKYHLLPHSVHVISAVRNNLSVESLDYVLFLGAFTPSGQPPGAPVSQRRRLGELPLGSEWMDRLRVIDIDPRGVLFAVNGPVPQAESRASIGSSGGSLPVRRHETKSE